jgi:hypothetical protein
LSAGTLVAVKPDWMYQYRKPGVTTSGVVKALSPNGKIVRVQMDDLGDSYLAVEHVEPASVDKLHNLMARGWARPSMEGASR